MTPRPTAFEDLGCSDRAALLVVEDDAGVREAVAFVLSSEGHEIIMASSGEEALELIAELDALDGLCTDILLSGSVMGWAVGEAFHRKWPTKPIVYVSSRVWPNPHLAPNGVFMRKPIDLRQLISAFTSRQ
jgi:CheY-like chemotaxis protein